MSEDRLEVIKGYREEIGNVTGDEIDWLISELEACREENQLLNTLFDMQQTRMKKATKLWQQATGKKDTLPDLGVLLEWLMAEVRDWKRYEQGTVNALVLAEAEVEKQRRHRKWALKKARNLWVVISMARRWGRHD